MRFVLHSVFSKFRHIVWCDSLDHDGVFVPIFVIRYFATAKTSTLNNQNRCHHQMSVWGIFHNRHYEFDNLLTWNKWYQIYWIRVATRVDEIMMCFYCSLTLEWRCQNCDWHWCLHWLFHQDFQLEQPSSNPVNLLQQVVAENHSLIPLTQH